MTVRIRAFEERDTEQTVALWHAAGLTRPWNDPYLDIERKLAVQRELFLVAVDAEEIVGTVMGGYDGHRGWLYYLATAGSHRGRGIGAALVTEVERLLLALGCPKVQLMVRPDNEGARGFYTALEYEPFDTWATGKRLIVD